MRLNYFLAAPLLLAVAGFAEERYNGQGSVTVPFAVNPEIRSFMGIIGGGDAFVYKGLAVQGEAGYLFSRRNFQEGFGVASVGPAYHFIEEPQPESRSFCRWRLQPAVPAGVSLVVARRRRSDLVVSRPDGRAIRHPQLHVWDGPLAHDAAIQLHVPLAA
ncbi:MAG: hypothetical protein IPM24_26360 [Bryobacterales bacterium]|nr:hypothetical protein [Bryobacterales bacterium]